MSPPNARQRRALASGTIPEVQSQTLAWFGYLSDRHGLTTLDQRERAHSRTITFFVCRSTLAMVAERVQPPSSPAWADFGRIVTETEQGINRL